MLRDLGERTLRDDETGQAVERTRTVLLFAVITSRLIAAAHVVSWLMLALQNPGTDSLGLTLAAVTAAHAVVSIIVFRHYRGVPVGWAVGEGAFFSVVLLVGASLRPGEFDAWRFAFPYTVSCAAVMGFAILSWRGFLSAWSLPTLAYLCSAIWLRPEGGWSIPQDLVTYFGALLAARGISYELRRNAQILDSARAREVTQRAELAVAEERAWIMRELHDHELQTLEILARERFIPDAAMRELVARQASRLRRLVEGYDDEKAQQPAEIEAAILAVVADHRARGLRIDMVFAAPRPGASPATTRAVAAAVGEALTNVRKHSGVDHATVHLGSSEEGLAVTVSDTGRGFDPSHITTGVGVSESICARVAEIGGRAWIHSTDGAGVRVEVRAPALPRQREVR